jgi:hypothetical protein
MIIITASVSRHHVGPERRLRRSQRLTAEAWMPGSPNTDEQRCVNSADQHTPASVTIKRVLPRVVADQGDALRYGRNLILAYRNGAAIRIAEFWRDNGLGRSQCSL